MASINPRETVAGSILPAPFALFTIYHALPLAVVSFPKNSTQTITEKYLVGTHRRKVLAPPAVPDNFDRISLLCSSIAH